MAQGSAAKLLGKLRALDLPKGDYAVFGSGPLVARGLLVHDQVTFWAMDRGALWALTKGVVAQLGQFVSGTTTHYPEPVLKLH
jgi:hypothetical protein